MDNLLPIVSKKVTFERSAMIVHRPLSTDDLQVLFKGLDQISGNYQFLLGDLWNVVEDQGGDPTDYVPEGMSNQLYNRIRAIRKRFVIDYTCQFNWLKYSHYAECGNKELPFDDADKILKAAEEGRWTVEAIRKAVKLVLGEPEPKPKPKAVECPSCGKWKVDMQDGTFPECPWCIIENMKCPKCGGEL